MRESGRTNLLAVIPAKAGIQGLQGIASGTLAVLTSP
jgi:hypothetical protein